MKRNILDKIGIVLFCIISAFTFLILFSRTLSPLYSYEICDSNVFKLMGLAILNGKVPYVDFFDHKGPMLYAIQALGQWMLPGRIGLFLLAVIGLSISIGCWYKSARLFTTPTKSIVTILLTLLAYYFVKEYGNLTEDWNIPFISISYYLILSLIISNKSKNYLSNGIIVGLCLASSFLIRPNDAVAFIGAPMFGALIWLVREKRYKECIKWIAGACIGFICVISIFVIWFAVHNALPDFWYGLIGFNAKYTAGIKGLIKGGFKIVKLAFLPFLITLLILISQCNQRCIAYILVPTIIAGYFLLGNNAYNHYWIAWIPILFFSYWLFAIIQKNKAFTVVAICMFLSLPFVNNKNWFKTPLHIYHEVKQGIHYSDSTFLYSRILFEDIIPEERDSIWSYNLSWREYNGVWQDEFEVLLINEIIPCNRVPLIFMAQRDTTLYKYMDITKTCPKYILYSPIGDESYTYSSRDSAYIETNYHISKTCEKPPIILYERNNEIQ